MRRFKGSGSGAVAIGKIYCRQGSGKDSALTGVCDAATEERRLKEAFLAAADAQKRSLEEDSALIDGLSDIILARHALFCDEELTEELLCFIRDKKYSAEEAVRSGGEELARRFLSLSDPYFRERATDIKDVCNELLRILSGERFQLPDEPVIYAAEEPYASEILAIGRDRLLAVLGKRGSLYSHAAIIAKNMGIPVIMGLPVDKSWDRAAAIVYGDEGTLCLAPDEAELKRAADMLDKQRLCEERYAKAPRQGVRTKSGVRIKLAANISSEDELKEALSYGAEAVGLFRSEALFLGRSAPPSEDEQYGVYSSLARKLKGRELVIRSADLGGDKSVGYVSPAGYGDTEDEQRGISLSLAHSGMFKEQLRAVLRAAACGNVSIMLPMLCDISELRQTKRLLGEAKAELRERGEASTERIRLGIMIETPAAALLSEELAKEADFFSIGTNDLARYTLAAGRGSLSYRPKHPAVLKLIELAAAGAHASGIPVCVCGELAADIKLLGFFLSLGIDMLSLSPRDIPQLAAHIREMS